MNKDERQNIPVFEPEPGTPELRQLEQLLEKAHPKLVGLDNEEIYLPKSIYQILRQVTPLLAKGKGVTLVPQDHYLTTQEAANLLNVSRPYLYTLLDDGQLPYTQVGTHRRIKAEDLFQYKEQRDLQRRQALAELTEYSQELGFYDQEKD